MPLVSFERDGRALDVTSDLIDDVNVLKPRINAALSQLSKHANNANGTSTNANLHATLTLTPPTGTSDLQPTPDVTPFLTRANTPQSSSPPSEVDPSDDKIEVVEEEVKVFRDYANACDRVKLFYAEQHVKQTYEFNLAARAHYHSREKLKMGVWEAMEKLNTLVDESDPDTDLSQIEHLLQTAESIRRDGKPDWMQLVGLVHDLGKLLFFLGAEGQWDVVGDTFPVGCAFSDLNIYPETFEDNVDSTHPVYKTKCGVYEEGCGVEKLMISWGHDEYMYLVASKFSTLPKEALAMIRFHSFYPWHRENAYSHFMAPGDEELLAAVRDFNPYDLYSKADKPIVVEDVKEYYQGLIAKYFAPVVEW
ncbi:hypothetical protein FRC14_005705 [Serendipita sp. 396]|nr:hypothetical protein FRC14_005705 [Serendipita sp. 396]